MKIKTNSLYRNAKESAESRTAKNVADAVRDCCIYATIFDKMYIDTEGVSEEVKDAFAVLENMLKKAEDEARKYADGVL